MPSEAACGPALAVPPQPLSTASSASSASSASAASAAPRPSQLARLERARDECGVALASPAAIKSFALKFLELARTLALLPTDPPAAVGLGKLVHRRSAGSDYFASQAAECRAQLAVCSQLLALMHGGVAMLDEVDWLLHPLKSELNWPLGEREPLDFSKSRSGSGLRWKLPSALLDAVFHAAGATVTDREAALTHEATAALAALRAALLAGREQQQVQTTPHLALLSCAAAHTRPPPLLRHPEPRPRPSHHSARRGAAFAAQQGVSATPLRAHAPSYESRRRSPCRRRDWFRGPEKGARRPPAVHNCAPPRPARYSTVPPLPCARTVVARARQLPPDLPTISLDLPTICPEPRGSARGRARLLPPRANA